MFDNKEPGPFGPGFLFGRKGLFHFVYFWMARRLTLMPRSSLSSTLYVPALK